MSIRKITVSQFCKTLLPYQPVIVNDVKFAAGSVDTNCEYKDNKIAHAYAINDGIIIIITYSNRSVINNEKD